MVMEIRDRFKMIIERKQLTAGEFAESIDVVPSTISHILSSRNKYPSTEVLLKLRQRYPDVNINWLLNGEGNMYNELRKEEQIPNEYSLFADNPENISMRCSAGDTDRPLGHKEKETKTHVEKEIIYKEKPPRRITEIRIFFDDNTYETFKPE